MKDEECVGFLQWCLPRHGLRWAGYRKVRRTVCKRLRRRLRELGLGDLDAYRARLEEVPEEWRRLDAICRIPISRFYRDRGVFEALRCEVLPHLEHVSASCGNRTVRCWSAGCASGEEVYSLAIAWVEKTGRRDPGTRIEILGTDADETMIQRAEIACYGSGSLKDLPSDFRDRAFERRDDRLCVRRVLREGIGFRLQDLRTDWPEDTFDLILCRNLAFTYFAAPLQSKVFIQIDRRLRSHGYLVIGSRERLPAEFSHYGSIRHGIPIYRRLADAPGTAAQGDPTDRCA